MDQASLIARITEVLAPESGVHVAILYGSRAAGRATPHSDVDLAVAGTRKLPLEMRLTLGANLEASLGLPVDLIDLQAVDGTILREALTQGLVLFNRLPPVLAAVMKRLWYQEADFMPQYRAALAKRRERFVRGSTRH